MQLMGVFTEPHPACHLLPRAKNLTINNMALR